jgi:hypothetical protein
VPSVVTGIAPTTDVTAVEKALRDGGYSLEPFSVYVAGDAPEGHPDSGGNTLFTGTDSIRDILARGSGGIYSSGGGSVPGLTQPNSKEYFPQETMDDELGDLEIPDSELANYEEAMNLGHAVVAYFAKEDNLEAIEGVFTAAGVRNVRVY